MQVGTDGSGRPAEPTDAVMYRQLAETFSSKGFQLFLGRIAGWANSDQQQLRIEIDSAELHRNQGRAQRAHQLLELPAMMLAECKPAEQGQG